VPYIKTTYEDEKELISGILEIYNGGQGVQLDPTFSTGRFWKGLPSPSLKFDLSPQLPDIIQANCISLPLESDTVSSIMFDPPFIIGVGESKTGIMTNRFSGFKSLNSLKSLYTSSLTEFSRILVKNGLLIFKCQDTVTGGKQFLSHCFIISEAEKLGYFCHDIIILVRRGRIVDPKWGKQQHAYKTHSYYLVFSKGNKNPAISQ
jgi:hypothetical protein